MIHIKTLQCYHKDLESQAFQIFSYRANSNSCDTITDGELGIFTQQNVIGCDAYYIFFMSTHYLKSPLQTIARIENDVYVSSHSHTS